MNDIVQYPLTPKNMLFNLIKNVVTFCPDTKFKLFYSKSSNTKSNAKSIISELKFIKIMKGCEFNTKKKTTENIQQ